MAIRSRIWIAVLPDDVASIPLSELDTKRLLDRMNFHLNTSYDFSEGRLSLLEICFDPQFSVRDFGVAYSLRWRMNPQHAIENIHECRNMDGALRQKAVEGNIIHSQYQHIWPRRVWDLWSNRVIPTWMSHRSTWEKHNGEPPDFFAVSHAWVDEEKRQAVETPINGREWPVPIPSTATLERIRTELLHHTTTVAPTVNQTLRETLLRELPRDRMP